MLLRKLAVALFLLALAGCGGQNPTSTLGKDAMAQLIKVAVEESCKISPNVIDIATSLGGQALGPAGVIAAPLANQFAKNYAAQLCAQWKARKATSAVAGDGCVAIMNRTCIRMQ